jgi:5'-phosphate synthase pdxT subunit
LRAMVTRGFPVLATCAGAILMAREIRGESFEGNVGVVPVAVKRNAYGSQQDSFEAVIRLADGTRFPGIFIRAPRFYSLDQSIGIQAMLDEEPVAVSWKKVTLTSFHPELTLDPKIHKIFLRDCEKHSQ